MVCWSRLRRSEFIDLVVIGGGGEGGACWERGANIWVLTNTDPPGRWCRKTETPTKCEVLVT